MTLTSSVGGRDYDLIREFQYVVKIDRSTASRVVDALAAYLNKERAGIYRDDEIEESHSSDDCIQEAELHGWHEANELNCNGEAF